MPYCQFPISLGPPPPPLPRISILPATLAQLSQLTRISRPSVTGAMLHNVTMLSFCHKEQFAMLHCINDKVKT